MPADIARPVIVRLLDDGGVELVTAADVIPTRAALALVSVNPLARKRLAP